jgi:RNA polymerase sigma-70 factor (ECF subfamily)
MSALLFAHEETQPGIEDGLVRTFEELREKLFRALVFMLGDYQEAQDALQVAFLRCWRARDTYPRLRNARAWVWRVTLNAGRDLRDRVWRHRARPLSLVEDSALCPEGSPAELLEDREERSRLRAALTHLRPEEKEVFLLRQHHALTFEEIARQRGCPIGTAKTLMRAAVRKLRCALHEKQCA